MRSFPQRIRGSEPETGQVRAGLPLRSLSPVSFALLRSTSYNATVGGAAHTPQLTQGMLLVGTLMGNLAEETGNE